MSVWCPSRASGVGELREVACSSVRWPGTELLGWLQKHHGALEEIISGEAPVLPHQMQYAQSRFRSMIEGSSGNEFEKLFHRVMELRHEDYVPIRTAGSIGDLGGDGLRTVGRRLYACYAPETFNVSEVRGRFRGDLESAITQRPDLA